MTPRATALLLFLLLLCGLAACQSSVALLCPVRSEKYPPRSNYSSNLGSLLLQRIYKEGRILFYYNVTEGDPPDTVYGHFLCRPDVTADACLSCIDKGSSNIVTSCHEWKEAIIWYDECLVRYSNRSFFSVMESTPVSGRSIPLKSSYSDFFRAALPNLVWNTTDWAVASVSHYATTNLAGPSFMEMNVRAQCTPDLTRPDCRHCLAVATSIMNKLSDMKQSAQFYLPSCYIRYEISGSKTHAELPGPAVNGRTDSEGGHRKASVRKWVVSSTITGVCLVTIFAGSCILRKLVANIREGKEIGKQVRSINTSKDLRGKVLNIESRAEVAVNNSGDKYSMRLCDIRMATNNFSDDCKIGQGGFGPVYKVRKQA
ncbi:hypothetical protein MLD38_037196 [Melastoma candidum]|uniref:Uncharacterized protein n=1 Tax=Melastoma candidum TaxID=119954 RepID=A0ACB9LM08_9MYRT|nr:hypothetical protein MLD38_037196 [Melastoma candidum]